MKKGNLVFKKMIAFSTSFVLSFTAFAQQSPNLIQVPMPGQQQLGQMQPLIPGVINPRPSVPGVLQPLNPDLSLPIKPGPALPGTPGGATPTDPWLPPVFPGNSDPTCRANPTLPWCQANSCFQNPTLPQCRGTGSIYVPAPGTTGPVDANGRPMIFTANNMPAEYDCPLFENRPYESLNQAIDALSYVMSSSPECSQQRSSIDAIEQNKKTIKDAVAAIQGYMAANGGIGPVPGPNTPGTPGVDLPPLPGGGGLPGTPMNPQGLDQSVQAAIQAATNIGQMFSNNSLLQTRCGREVMSTGKVLLALNDMLNSLAPLALLAAAVAPGVGVAAKFAITGGAVFTSTVSSMAKMIEQGTVDMTNPEHRKAVLKNTCQYTNIARKVRFMQLAQTGQITKISAELDKKLEGYRKFLSKKSDDLNQVLSYKESMERAMYRSELQASKDNFELAALEGQVNESKDDDLYTCLLAQQMVKKSAREDIAVFPVTVMTNLDQVVVLAREDQNSTQVVGIKTLNDISRKRIAGLTKQVSNDDGAAIKLCAQTTRSWVVGLRNALKLTRNLMSSERADLENELATNSEYALWREQYTKLQSEQNTVNRVSKVMKELAKDSSVIDRSELDQRMSLLKSSLFGTAGAWKWGHSPIQEWLEHTMRLHANRISSMTENLKNLQRQAVNLTSGGRLIFLRAGMGARGGSGAGMTREQIDQSNRQAMSDIQSANQLESINVNTVKPGTRSHELACQLLETTWLDWSAAVDHLSATEFMCDMIDAQLDNKVETAIVAFCRGDLQLNGRQAVQSEIQKAKGKIAIDKALTNKSYRDWAFVISKKIQDMKCPLPGTSDLN